VSVSELLAERSFVDASNVSVKRKVVPNGFGFCTSTYGCRNEHASMG
jgi:hypothetical protein